MAGAGGLEEMPRLAESHHPPARLAGGWPGLGVACHPGSRPGPGGGGGAGGGGGTGFAWTRPPMLPPRRILLADDDAALRSGIAELLGTLGLEVRHAETGLEAVALARLDRFGAALLDLHMPGCTGLEAIRRLRDERLELPCIVYSGRLTEALEAEALQVGAFSVLRKPVAPDLLRNEILRALGPPGLHGN